MIEKTQYLSIGEVSKMSGVGVKALKYYEKINILKPAFIHPTTKYRYYVPDQLNLLHLIQICIELNIPLKELIQFIDEDERIDYASLLSYGKDLIQKKMITLQQGLQFIVRTEKEMKLSNDSAFYSCTLPEKTFAVVPYNPPFNQEDMYKKCFDLGVDWDDEQWHPFSSLEFGILQEYLPTKVNHYFFVEITAPSQFAGQTKTIPSGVYLCHQSDCSQIDQAPEIFTDLFNQKDRILVIETEVFSPIYQLTNLKKELRVIAF